MSLSTEALWAGVPVLTFNGDRWVSRTSRSLLLAAGLDAWCAADLHGYIERAVSLARNPTTPAELAALRHKMRADLAASAFATAPGCAARLKISTAVSRRRSARDKTKCTIIIDDDFDFFRSVELRAGRRLSPLTVWRYISVEIVRRQKCRHAVLESVTAYVAVTRVADVSRAAITLMIVPVGVLETHPLEVGRLSRAKRLMYKFRGYPCLKRPDSLVPFTPNAS